MNSSSRNVLTSLVMLALVWLIATPCQAQWRDYIQPDNEDEPPVVEVEDNPEWDTYAFELDYINRDGTLSFHDLARTQQPFVLFFWLTDCPVCHMQMPYVQKLQSTIAEAELPVTLVLITLDFGPQNAIEFIAEREITATTLIDPRGRQTDRIFELEDRGCPLAFVFGEDGLPVGDIHGFQSHFAAEVAALLNIELPED